MKLISPILLVILLSCCSIENAPPASGPNDSWWLGGDDGGVFIKIVDDENTADRIYTGVIYYDTDQSIWYKGKFELIGTLDFSPEDHTAYLFWDGADLHLRDSSRLRPLAEIPEL